MTTINQEIVTDNSFTELLFYKTPNGRVKIEIFLRDETIWLTQARISELFGVDRSVVTKHLQVHKFIFIILIDIIILCNKNNGNHWL